MFAYLSFKLARRFGVRPVVVNLILLHLLIGVAMFAYGNMESGDVQQTSVPMIFILMYVVLVVGVVGLGRLASKNFFRKPDEWEEF
ncbi:uncharacterized protein METZ01_LOCUS356891 [marine metagenome]|uniref:Uncharacterized protein n=1 Tax=marine metagenome TaxID=408172 RepID=A0A382S469_9ZZZZ